MRKSKIKAVPYGSGEREQLQVRTQGVKVRMQDQDMGKPYILDPLVARRLAAALTYAAHHAERPLLLPDQLKALDEQT